MSDLIELAERVERGEFMPAQAFLDDPEVKWNHVDGPLMTWAGHMHWLTRTERVCLRLRIITLGDIALARFPSYRFRRQTAALASQFQKVATDPAILRALAEKESRR